MAESQIQQGEKKKAIRFIGLGLLLLIAFGVNYLLVYDLSYTPNGYEVVAKDEESITIQTYDIFNMEEKAYTTTFSGNEKWRVESLTDSVERHKLNLYFLFTCITISSSLFIIYRKEGFSLWKAFWRGHGYSFIPPLAQLSSISSRIMDIIG
ncbi:hypothetical protein [Saliterribacillus persicus]|uniref:Uncharacterized protein n=1 Tax=Saliterribacillus persicus TaxID=930114 RepID=A0A368X4F8_9BACI|nr:hypothetical protein [Saliterribacillus persicus]RCW62579.1 hypothetical protein DFR57_12522 [Saliterribacillus persicus]